MLEGTGALAGRRDRQTGQAPPGVFNSVWDHSKEEEAAKCVVSKISQTTYLDPIFNQKSTADPQKVIQESKARISEARTSVFFFFFFLLCTLRTPSGRNPLAYSFRRCPAPSGCGRNSCESAGTLLFLAECRAAELEPSKIFHRCDKTTNFSIGCNLKRQKRDRHSGAESLIGGKSISCCFWGLEQSSEGRRGRLWLRDILT